MWRKGLAYSKKTNTEFVHLVQLIIPAVGSKAEMLQNDLRADFLMMWQLLLVLVVSTHGRRPYSHEEYDFIWSTVGVEMYRYVARLAETMCGEQLEEYRGLEEGSDSDDCEDATDPEDMEGESEGESEEESEEEGIGRGGVLDAWDDVFDEDHDEHTGIRPRACPLGSLEPSVSASAVQCKDGVLQLAAAEMEVLLRIGLRTRRISCAAVRALVDSLLSGGVADEGKSAAGPVMCGAIADC